MRFYLGIEGGGFSIGRKGLKAVAKKIDGRGKKTTLTNVLNEKYRIEKANDFITKVYSDDFEIPKVADDLIKCAEKGDVICRNIIEDELKETALHIKSVWKTIGTKEIPLCFYGGLIDTDNYYNICLKKKLKMLNKHIKIIKPKSKAEFGAALLAKQYFNLNQKQTI